MNTGTYKSYRKPNDEILYIRTKCNYPAKIFKQLPISIETRLSNLSSNSEIFHEASKYYQNTLNQFGYDYKLQCKPLNNDNENKSKLSENRKRNIIWFSPPFSKNVSNNISKYFLPLIQKHFPNNHKYHEIFNKNNVKISCSCMANIKSIINMHNKEVITEKKTQAIKCNCVNKPNCPISKECQMKKYTTEPAKVHLNSVMETIRNHSITKNIGQTTELSTEYWRLKEVKAQPQVQFYILKRCRPTKRTGICYLSLNEKLFIIYHDLKQISVDTKCRQF